MRNTNIDHCEPWDQGTYQTGSTNPPKSRSGLVAVLLILVIFLAGIVSILGIMNIRLFSALNAQSQYTVPLALYVDPDAHTHDRNQTVPPAPSVPVEPVSIQTSPAPDQQEPLSLQEIYKQNINSVVSITCSGNAGNTSGAGVVITRSGYIVTNCHMVQNTQSVTVQLSDDRAYRASIVGTDAASDLAVLYVDAQDLTPAQFGNSDHLEVGDAVCAIGDPLGAELRGTMTDGIVSAINRDITTGGRTMTLIQTNAALNSGNSGGPLINRYGQVIGINTMKIGSDMDAAGVEGIGFAIPSAMVVDVISQLINQGYVAGRPCLGIAGEPVSALYQHYYRLPAGIFITHITEGSNADIQGLEVGDILLSLDGKPVTTEEELSAFLCGCQVSNRVDAVIYRNKAKYTVTLTIEETKG